MVSLSYHLLQLHWLVTLLALPQPLLALPQLRLPLMSLLLCHYRC